MDEDGGDSAGLAAVSRGGIRSPCPQGTARKEQDPAGCDPWEQRFTPSPAGTRGCPEHPGVPAGRDGVSRGLLPPFPPRCGWAEGDPAEPLGCPGPPSSSRSLWWPMARCHRALMLEPFPHARSPPPPRAGAPQPCLGLASVPLSPQCPHPGLLAPDLPPTVTLCPFCPFHPQLSMFYVIVESI